MTLNFGDAVNSATRWILNIKAVNAIASGPFYTAIVLSIVIMLIAAFVFRDSESSEGLHIMALRVGFWAFVANVMFLYLHYKVTNKSGGGEDIRDLLSKPTTIGSNITIAPVIIKPFTE